jgi:hypothetical protein
MDHNFRFKRKVCFSHNNVDTSSVWNFFAFFITILDSKGRCVFSHNNDGTSSVVNVFFIFHKCCLYGFVLRGGLDSSYDF